MKAAEVQIGVEYAVGRGTLPSLYSMVKFVPKAVVQKRVRNSTTYGSRMATMVEGTAYYGPGREARETEYAPQHIQMLWSERQAQMKRNAEQAEESARIKAAAVERRKPLVEAYDAFLREMGKSGLYDYTKESMVNYGKVDYLSIEGLSEMLAFAEAKGRASALQDADAAEQVATERQRETQAAALDLPEV